MPLFHPRIIEKYTKASKGIPDTHEETLKSWAESLNKGVFDRETSHDSEFIQRILIDILGYKGSSSGEEWTLAKNHTVGSGNVDIALGHFSLELVQIIAPFELKGTKTRDLDAIMAGRNKSPVQQAWEYAMDIKGAKWVLVSNYHKIRIYAVGYGRKNYEEFDLTQLTDPVQYARFTLILSAENLLGSNTLTLLKESENKDTEITNKFYKDYKALRIMMIDTLAKENPATPMLDIIKHTQTILDRILFVAFAEDRGLLPSETLKSCYEDRGKWNPQSAWDNFKSLFNSIDKGNSPLKIPGYNGGLFAQNEQLNNLKVSDAVCQGFKTIGCYDFDSDISVNILGHIFEQSITDLEEIKSSFNNEEDSYDKKKSKRKKDGIFYTPSYITHYIVEQAVGGWLIDRKKEIGFDKLPVLTSKDYEAFKQTRRRGLKDQRNIEAHIRAWEAYKLVLFNIKVLDPACGSGAFLNEVFDFLYDEGQVVNNQLAILKRGQGDLFRWDTHILSNNIYGVDINSESVEITKLSLWLKTANRNEKLTYLDDNIKCGNSLIDDSAVAGELAFKWEEEFPDIILAGGFDIVVGNPPYVFAREKISQTEKDYYSSAYSSAQYQVNTYLLFIEKSLLLIKSHTGRLGLIVPNTWLMVNSAVKLRQLLLEQTLINRITNLTGYSFEKVNVETIILDLIKSQPSQKQQISIYQNNPNNDFDFLYDKQQEIFIKNEGYEFQIFMKHTDFALIDKIKANTYLLEEVADIKAGLQAYEVGKGNPKQSSEDVRNRVYDYDYKLNSHTFKYLDGKNVERYGHTWEGTYLLYGNNLAAPRTFNVFSDNVIIVREIPGKYPHSIVATFSDENEVYLFNRSNIAVLQKEANQYELKYLLAVLNSSIMSFYFMRTNPKAVRQMFPKIILSDLREFPIKKASKTEQQPFIEKANIMLVKSRELNEHSAKFRTFLKSEFGIEKLSRKLEHSYALNFNEFVNELESKQVSLSLKQKAEWMEYFEKGKATASTFKSIIATTDREIDYMVYALYGFTPEEIAIIEGDK